MRSALLCLLAVAIAATCTGAVRASTVSMAPDELLASSPDGRWIAFGRGSSTLVMDAVGRRLHRVGRGGRASTAAEFSPDGRWIAFGSSSFPGRFVVVEVATGRPVADFEGSTVAWSPSSSQLAVETRWVSRGCNDFVSVVDVPSGGERRFGRGEAPAWSPRGDRIAFERCGGGISLVAPDGANRVDLTAEGEYPTWSPRGGLLSYSSHGELHVRDLRTGADRVVAPGRRASWSPAADVFALTSDGTTVVYRADGSEIGRVAGLFASWSPDGRRLLLHADSYFEYAVANADGSGRRHLVRAWSIDWSGSDSLVYGTTGCAPGRGLYRIRVADLRRTRLTDHCSIHGTSGDDTLDGTDGPDSLTGRGGADRLRAGDADDWADGGAGRDAIDAGRGNDVVVARDREVDAVTCGPGRDRVVADRGDDVAADCERVAR